jgi:hypothetical protein
MAAIASASRVELTTPAKVPERLIGDTPRSPAHPRAALGSKRGRRMIQQQDSYSLAAQEDRSGPRAKLTIPAQLRASGGRAFQTVIHDLSVSGFSAAALNRMHEGQLCWLTLRGLESLQAQVVWWEKCMVGCAFSELLSPIVFDSIITRFGSDEALRSA